MYNLSGKIVLVVGSTGILGSEITKKFYKNNCKVIGTYLSSKKVSSIVDYQKLNINEIGEIDKIRDYIKKTYKKLDIVINASGVNKPEDFDKIKEKDWDQIINSNLKDLFLLCKGFCHLRKITVRIFCKYFICEWTIRGSRTALCNSKLV